MNEWKQIGYQTLRAMYAIGIVAAVRSTDAGAGEGASLAVFISGMLIWLGTLGWRRHE
jgi:hypothetical protein